MLNKSKYKSKPPGRVEIKIPGKTLWGAQQGFSFYLCFIVFSILYNKCPSFVIKPNFKDHFIKAINHSN